MNEKKLQNALEKIEYLYTHNKNLTKAQYYTVDELRDFLRELKEGGADNA